jgi:hypothetical protein
VLHRPLHFLRDSGDADGKPAGVRCRAAHPDNRCAIFEDPIAPLVCAWLIPNEAMCGRDFEEAMALSTALEVSDAT